MPKIFFLSIIVLLTSCGSVDDTPRQTEQRVGIIDSFGGSSEVIIAPDTVQAGEAFSVTVRTYGNDCTEAGRMESEVGEDIAVLKPYDLTLILREDEACALIETRPAHTSQIIFEESGPATIRVEGIKEDNANPRGVPTTIEKTITVQ